MLREKTLVLVLTIRVMSVDKFKGLKTMEVLVYGPAIPHLLEPRLSDAARHASNEEEQVLSYARIIIIDW